MFRRMFFRKVVQQKAFEEDCKNEDDPKHEHELTPEQIAARVTYAAADSNTKPYAAGAVGYSSGVTFGCTLGGIAGGLIGSAFFGIGATLGILIGAAIGAIIGGACGAMIGRHVGKIYEKKSVVELKEKLGRIAEESVVQEIITPVVTSEMKRIEQFNKLLYEKRIVKNTSSHFYKRVSPQILSYTQMKLYSAMLDAYIIEKQLNSNIQSMRRWNDSVKGVTLYKEMELDLLKHIKKVKSLTTKYIEEKKAEFLPDKENDFSQSEIELIQDAGSSSRVLDRLMSNVIIGETREKYEVLLEAYKRQLDNEFENISKKEWPQEQVVCEDKESKIEVRDCPGSKNDLASVEVRFY